MNRWYKTGFHLLLDEEAPLLLTQAPPIDNISDKTLEWIVEKFHGA